MDKNKPFPLPTGYFGIPLGLGALSLGWWHLAETMPQALLVSDVLGIVACAVWGFFMGLYAYKIIAFRAQVLEEYHCPVRFSFIAMIPITTMLSGAILFRWVPALGEALIWIGTVGQLLFSSLRISELWEGGVFEDKSTRPPFYLPSVATNFTSATTLSLLGHHDLGYLFFGAGMIAWLIYEPVLLHRLRIYSVEPPFRPTLGIILAPAFVGSSAYLAVNHGEVDAFVKILWGYGFLQLFFLIRILPWIAENGLNIGFWGFSFGLASMVGSSIMFYNANVLPGVAIFAFVFGNLMILGLILLTLYKIAKGQFWLK